MHIIYSNKIYNENGQWLFFYRPFYTSLWIPPIIIYSFEKYENIPYALDVNELLF